MQGSIRLPEPRVRPEVDARGGARADVLRPFRGRHVVGKDEVVLFDADTPPVDLTVDILP